MKVIATERTGTQAVEELRALYDRYKDRPRGQKLTLKIIADQCGGLTLATVSRWISTGDAHHKPLGAILSNLGDFLDKAANSEWLEKLIKKGSK